MLFADGGCCCLWFVVSGLSVALFAVFCVLGAVCNVRLPVVFFLGGLVSSHGRLLLVVWYVAWCVLSARVVCC